jgi:hypothetical protein
MEQNENLSAPEPATDEPGSPSSPADAPDGPVFASEEAAAAYWQGVTDGIRDAGREPGHPHMPADFDLGLTRDGAAPALVSAKLLEPWPYNPNDASPALLADPKTRHDGWDPVKERSFICTLADTGVVADACRACKMSRTSAYEHRRRAAGRAFALGWDAAILIARGAVTDDVMSRSRHGVIDRVYRNGELVAERHRYDNRLTMAVLTRLDRQAEGLGENAPLIRAIAQEFDRFLDILPKGVAGAEQFVAARFPTPARGGAPRPPGEPSTIHGDTPVPGTESALLARLGAYREFGVGLPGEIDLADLDPEEMERWTEAQWDRAEFSGLLETLTPADWPESAREPGPDEADGMCQLRKLYLRYNPPKGEASAADDFAGRSVWEEEDGEWITDFPPAAGFDGWQEGTPGDDDYRRELTEAERKAVGVDEASEAAERDAELATEHAARDRFFGFSGDEAPDPDSNAKSSPGFPGEGDHAKHGGGAASVAKKPLHQPAAGPPPLESEGRI